MSTIDDYLILQVDGLIFSRTIRDLNALDDYFPKLEPRHFLHGYWWLASFRGAPVAFAGLVPMTPFEGVGYLKRCYVKADHHGHGLQLRMLAAREVKARLLGWTQLVAECRADNAHCINNFRKAGFERCDPEQRWGQPGSAYWTKSLRS
ncbi:GNAT family N-acetyltransferase [Bradyrhizobium lablabi]|uniref:GNAT family N-acetyltransferase n=1 Tax=Bradyrhizobium lablabi TaxID=722472 RepID=UPI001BAAEA3E|nr:GNAT family N-acetyltransferase [Bradyrhizobium lablabi]MBR0693698.1 GNAT family N-acetyltransferase [Bradyrhizobium lablabi]